MILKLFHIHDGTDHLVSAESPEEALKALHNYVGCSFLSATTEELPKDKIITVNCGGKTIKNTVEFILRKFDKKGIYLSVYKS